MSTANVLGRAKRKAPNGRPAILFQRAGGKVVKARVLVLAFDETPKRCRVRLLKETTVAGRVLAAGMMPMVPKSAVKLVSP